MLQPPTTSAPPGIVKLSPLPQISRVVCFCKDLELRTAFTFPEGCKLQKEYAAETTWLAKPLPFIEKVCQLLVQIVL